MLDFNNYSLISEWVHFKTSVCCLGIISLYLETSAFIMLLMVEALTSGFAIFSTSRLVNLWLLKNRTTPPPPLLPFCVNASSIFVDQTNWITSITVAFQDSVQDFSGLFRSHRFKFSISDFFLIYLNISFWSASVAPMVHLEKCILIVGTCISF